MPTDARRARSTARRPRRFHPLVVALAAALAMVAGACGGGDDEGGVLDTFASAVEATNAAETVRTRFTISFDDVPGVPPGGIVTDGVSTMDGTRGEGTFSQFGEELDFLIVDEAYYYAFPDLPEGKSWVRITFEELKAQSGLDVSAAAQQSPTDALSVLQASGEVTEVGDEDLDGVATTRYRGRIDIASANEETGFASEELVEQMRGLMGDSYDMDVWIDGEGLVRKMQWSVDLSESPDPPVGMPDEGFIRYEMELFDFDQPLDVEAPPESEVASLAELN
jgi:hypothetical protein